MADFEITWGELYFEGDGSNSGGGAQTGVLSNGDATDTFTFGDPLTFGGSPIGTFAGATEVNGLQFVLIDLDSPANFVRVAGDLNGADGLSFPFPDNLADLTITNTDPTDEFTVCFAAGTLIATPDGETTVETLSIGDLLLIQDGRTVPVKWIGRQTVHKLFTPAERFVPVRVSAGALGDSLPHTDLVLTADHALIFDGLAITAGSLVNGTTIAYTPNESLPERATYYHIETEGHQVILANGAAAETYVDYIQRSAFDNYQEYLDLYGEDKVIAEMPLPRISAARLVPPSIRARLASSDAA